MAKITFNAQDHDDVRERIIKAETICRDWHTQIVNRRKLYDGEHYSTKAKKSEVRFIDPTYRNTVDLSVGILLGNEMKWHAVGWTQDVATQLDTDNIEKFLGGVIEINTAREEYNIIHEVYKHFTKDGEAVLYGVWDKNLAAKFTDTIEELDEEKTTVKTDVFLEPPELAQVIDPLKIIMLPGGHKRWQMITCKDSMSVADAEKQFDIEIQKYTRLTPKEKEDTIGELKDYWDFHEVKKGKGDKTYTDYIVRHAVLFEDEYVREIEVAEGYDDLPYTIGFFQPNNLNDPKNWGSSIIDPLVPSVQMLEKGINRRQKQIDTYSSLPLVMNTKDGKKIALDPGMGENAIALGEGESLAFPVWPGNAPDVADQIDFMRARVQQSGFSDVMFGSGNSQVSGYALSQLGDQNRIRLEQPVTHLEMFWSQWAKKTLSHAANFAENMKIRVCGRMRGQEYSRMVSGEDLDKYIVKCEIHPEFPNEKVRNHAMATQVKGILDDNTIMENYLGIEQPLDIQDKKIAQQALNNPIMMQYAMIRQFRGMADRGDKDAAIVLGQLEQQLLPQQGKPAGNNPEQPMGLQSANGQATPQASGGEPAGQSEAALINNLAGQSPQMDGSVA